MERIAIYGKGGVGKSVVATNLSARFAQLGRKVLHVGCDPKHDSAVRLTNGEGNILTVLEVLADDPNPTSTDGILHEGRLGIHCCEAGGPEPGLGCGGRGVARTLEFLDEMNVIGSGGYEVVMFDVLGDVVCGGFAAPLRQGFAEKVFIVISEEPMALFAANNISKAIHVYHPNGVVLGGFVASLKSPDADRSVLDRFAAALSTRVLAFIPRDPLITCAERARKTVVEYAPDSASSKAFAALADEIASIDPASVPLPTPLGDEAFFRFIKD
ncbi:MAG: AAA family ATPase [Deltaproteobacteria bacterium]|nr:AAA family ATPase [Deltaproteobacteria bacterium]